MAFSQELADKICQRLAEGESLRAICRDEGMPDASLVLRWAEVEPFAQQYTQARARGYMLLSEEILEISDEEADDATAVGRNRLRVDSRKWMLSKMLPKVYGDKLELGSDPSRPLVIEKIVREVIDPKA